SLLFLSTSSSLRERQLREELAKGFFQLSPLPFTVMSHDLVASGAASRGDVRHRMQTPWALVLVPLLDFHSDRLLVEYLFTGVATGVLELVIDLFRVAGMDMADRGR